MRFFIVVATLLWAPFGFAASKSEQFAIANRSHEFYETIKERWPDRYFDVNYAYVSGVGWSSLRSLERKRPTKLLDDLANLMLEGNRSDVSIAVFGEKSPNTAVVLASALELAVLSRKRFPKLFVIFGGARAEADPLRTKFEAAGARFEFLEYGPKQ